MHLQLECPARASSKMSGVGWWFGPVVFRVHNANLSPYLRSFPRQRIFQGSGKSNWKCIRLPICFFPGRQKAKWFRLPICFSQPGKKQNGSDFQFAFSRAGKKQNGQTSNLLFPGPGKRKMVQTSNLLFSKPGKSKMVQTSILLFPGPGKSKMVQTSTLPPGREKANMYQTCSLEPGLETSRACGIRALSRALSIRRQLSEKHAFFQALQKKIGCPICFSGSNFQFAFLPGVTTMLYAHLQP